MRSLDSNQPKLPKVFSEIILKLLFAPVIVFFSLSNALNYRFSPVQNLYRFEFVVFKRVLWLSVLGDIKWLPHACQYGGKGRDKKG